MKRQVERTRSPQSCSRVVQRQFVALLFSLILSLALTAKPAQAATITVTTTADSGAGSLRQAINDAAQGDTITFNLPNPSTITLNSQLTIAKNLTIQGPGAAALTISGANKSRVFFISPGVSGATNGPPAMSWAVTIADLTITNGKALGTSGNFGSPICCIHMGGGGGGGAGMGGAIFSNKSQLTIRGVTFRANQAQGGTSGSSNVPTNITGTFGQGFGGGGMGTPSIYGPYYGVDGSALGGRGGKGADGTLQGTYPNGALGPIGYPGGEGAGGGGGYPNKPSPGGVGGFGGGGGGGGGMTDRWYGATGGPGGVGGFGGGGGGGGGLYQQYGGRAAGGAGGQFGGKGGTGGLATLKGAPGGGGAGLGGAIFVRAGSLTLIDSSFLNNSAKGGQGFSEVFADPGQGKGGAIFILTTYNNQPTGANLTMSGCATFSGNSAANAAGSAADNHDIYGKALTALSACATGGVAGAALVAADTSTVDTAQPLTVTTLEAAPVITESLPMSVPAAVEVAPLITESVPVSVPVVETAPVVTESVPVSVPVVGGPPGAAPVVAEAPAVTTTQPITPVDAGVAPVAPDTSGQNQRLFLPIITNVAALAGAALGGAGGIALLGLVLLVVVGGLVRRRRRNR